MIENRISVIIPVYNAEKFLDECLESILLQTCRPTQIILVNDGSTDDSGAICDRYGEKYDFITVVHQANAGVCAARNAGLALVKEAYFTFVDSDDYLPVNAFEILLKDILEHNADIACGLMDNDPNCGSNNLENGNYELWQGKRALEKSLLDDPFTYSSCARLFRTERLGHIRFREGRKIHEDSFFNFCCFRTQPTVVVRNVGVYHYRRNLASASHAVFSEKFFDILYFAGVKKKIIGDEYSELMHLTDTMELKANMAMLNCLCNSIGNTYRKTEKECIRAVIRLRDSFVPATRGDKRWFWIITNHLYGLFKIYYRLRYCR